MLKQRVITASAIAIAFLSMLFLSAWYVFALFVGFVFSVAAWEWGNLAGLERLSSRLCYTGATVCLGLLSVLFVDQSRESLTFSVLLISCCWWVFALLWVQGYPSSAVIWGARILRLLMGWAVLLPAWVACIYLRKEPYGAILVLCVVLLVASADIGAYFAGRRFGHKKLAPKVSPGKSWEGLWGGLIFTLILAAVANLFFGRSQWLALFVIVVVTVVASVIGDLLESMVKRFRGVKDSGRLLPGHGGVLDRIDGLVAASPVFALAVLASQWTL